MLKLIVVSDTKGLRFYNCVVTTFITILLVHTTFYFIFYISFCPMQFLLKGTLGDLL